MAAMQALGGALYTAGQVRDVALDAARTIGEDVKTSAAQVLATTAQGAHQVAGETEDAAKRLKKELTPASVDV